MPPKACFKLLGEFDKSQLMVTSGGRMLKTFYNHKLRS
jgi:hypothetical protein